MPDHHAPSRADTTPSTSRWRRRLSEFAIAACVIVSAGVLTVVFTWLGLIRQIGRWLESSPAPAGTITGLIMVILALSPAAMWFFYRQFAATQLALSRLAGIDTLTGLPNRLGLTDRLNTAIESTRGKSTGVAVLFVDLDRFKVVNDTFGHELGDALMVQVAKRLRDAVRPGDEVSRYGGDEFVVICTEIANAGMAKQIAQRIIDAVTVSYATGTQTLNISCSIGISLTNTHGASAEDSLRDADVAMYQAKSAGPGAYRIYDHILGKALTPSAIEARLREAVGRHEFRVHYQPVVDTHDGRILGTEALLRWEDPERGLIEPGDFLPLLEETGLIVDVGTWVLGEACAQAARWRTEFPGSDLEMKVNVSARQLGQSDFAELVAQSLARNELSPESLVLEITESALMDDVSSAWAMLRKTKTSGVRLALDDFGTGFSSLSYVRQFSLDMLKIDRSFVSGIAHEADDLAIVAHVVGLAEALGMITVAEGVEESEQLRRLQILGCNRAQGFWFSPPVPATAISAMLADPTLPARWSNVADLTEIVELPPVRVGLRNPLGLPESALSIGDYLDVGLPRPEPDLAVPATPPITVRKRHLAAPDDASGPSTVDATIRATNGTANDLTNDTQDHQASPAVDAHGDGSGLEDASDASSEMPDRDAAPPDHADDAVDADVGPEPEDPPVPGPSDGGSATATNGAAPGPPAVAAPPTADRQPRAPAPTRAQEPPAPPPVTVPPSPRGRDGTGEVAPFPPLVEDAPLRSPLQPKVAPAASLTPPPVAPRGNRITAPPPAPRGPRAPHRTTGERTTPRPVTIPARLPRFTEFTPPAPGAARARSV